MFFNTPPHAEPSRHLWPSFFTIVLGGLGWALVHAVTQVLNGLIWAHLFAYKER